MSIYLVAADTQNLGILLFELAVKLPERSRLRGSTGGKVKHVEGKYYMLLTPVLAETYVSFAYRREGEIGRLVTNLCGHIITFYIFFLKPGIRLLAQTLGRTGAAPQRRARPIITYYTAADDTLRSKFSPAALAATHP